MTRLTETWNRSSTALASLVERPWVCTAVLLALQSMFRPYLGLVHDAKLYSLQVARHVWPRLYESDLFFAFGSQDSFSAFSRFVAPLARAIGLEPAFFLIWMICTAAIVYAEVQLVRRLVTNRALAAVALVLLALTDVEYGGMQVFRVPEAFLTARLPAVALVLLAFVQLLEARFVRAGTLLATAMVVHPLMGVPGLLVGGAFIASSRWKMERLAVIAVVGMAAVAAVVSIPTVGEPLLGRMDGEWLRITKAISAHCFVTLWSAEEWCSACMALAILFGAWRYAVADARRTPSHAALPGTPESQPRSLYLPPLVGRLTFWVAFTAVGGLFLNAYAEWTQYAFLIQGQAFRALWLAKLLAYPLGLFLVARLWNGDAVKVALAVPVAAYVLQPFVDGSMEGAAALQTIVLWIATTACAMALCRAWFCTRHQRVPLGLAVLTGMMAMSLIISIGEFLSFARFAESATEPISVIWWSGAHAVSAAVVAAASLAMVVLLVRRWGSGKLTAAVALSVWLVLAGIPVVMDGLRIGSEQLAEEGRDIAFVKSFLDPRWSGSPAQVYWPTDPGRIWYHLQGTSYFSWCQMCGIMFVEDLSGVASERAQLVKRFEVEWLRERDLPEAIRSVLLTMLQADIDEPLPEQRDLLRLAQDPALDWIVTKHQFGDLAVASNGSVYIYDARQLREGCGALARAK